MLRTIIENDAVIEAIDAAIDLNSRVVDAFDGLKWRLARQPEIGQEIGPSGLRVHRQDGTGNIPGLVVLYEYDDRQVTLRRIKVI